MPLHLFYEVLGIKARTLNVLGKHTTNWATSHHSAHFQVSPGGSVSK